MCIYVVVLYSHYLINTVFTCTLQMHVSNVYIWRLQERNVCCALNNAFADQRHLNLV